MKFPKSKQKNPRTFIYMTAAIALVGSIAWGDEACKDRPDSMKTSLKVSQSGLRKFVLTGYEYLRRDINPTLSHALDPNMSIPSDREMSDIKKKCNKNAIQKMPPEQANKVCFGLLSTKMWPKDWTDQKDIRTRLDGNWDKYNEPTQLRFKNFKVKMTPEKDPKISCKNNICDVEIGIEDLNVGFDLGIQSLNDSCVMAGVKNAKMSLNQGSSARRATIKARFRLTENLRNPIEIIRDSSKLDLPSDAIQFSGESAPHDKQMCALKAGKDLNAAVPYLLSSLVTGNQAVLDDIMASTRDALVKSLSESVVPRITEHGFGTDVTVKAPIPTIMDLQNHNSLTDVVNGQIKFADRYMASLTQVRTPHFKPLAGVLEKRVDNFVTGFEGSADRNQAAAQVTQKWEEVAKALQEKISENNSKLATSSIASAENKILSSELAAVQSALKKLNHSRDPLQFGVLDQSMPVDMVLTAIQTNDLKDEIEFLLNGCFRCRQNANPDKNSGKWAPEPAKWDIGAQTSWGTMNQLISYMSPKYLDFCFHVSDKVRRACQNIRPTDDNSIVHFGSDPVIGWSPKYKAISVTLKNLQLNNQNNSLAFVGKAMKADVTLYGNFKLAEDGKSVKFIPLLNSTEIKNANFSSVSQTESGNSLLTWIAEEAINSSVGKKLAIWALESQQSRLTPSVAMAPGYTVNGLSTSPDGLSVYLSMPEDLRSMLSTDTAASTKP